MTSLPVSPRQDVVSGGQTVAVRSICCTKVEYEAGYCEFVYAVSAIFLLPVWPETAVGALFSPVNTHIRLTAAISDYQYTGSSCGRPEVATCVVDTTTPITLSVT